MAIRVLITDDHGVVRQGPRMFLSLDPDIEVVGEAANGQEAVIMARDLNPDMDLMDLLMRVMDGIEATKAIRSELPDVEVIALTSVLEGASVTGAVGAGTLGYLLTNTEAKEPHRAVKASAEGQPHLASEAAAKLMDEVRAPVNPEALTERETEVLRLLARGKANKQIATSLFVGEKTDPTPRAL
jgi:two-component system, NarL family, response regulator LiaR